MNDSKTRMTVIFGFLLIMALFFFMTVMNIRSGYYPNSFYWGLLLGILPGIGTCLHMYDTWDPKNLRQKDANKKTLDPKWIPFVVIAGLATSRITSEMLPEIIDQFFTGIIGAWLFVVMGYMAIQAWRHR